MQESEGKQESTSTDAMRFKLQRAELVAIPVVVVVVPTSLSSSSTYPSSPPFLHHFSSPVGLKKPHDKTSICFSYVLSSNLHAFYFCRHITALVLESSAAVLRSELEEHVLSQLRLCGGFFRPAPVNFVNFRKRACLMHCLFLVRLKLNSTSSCRSLRILRCRL